MNKKLSVGVKVGTILALVVAITGGKIGCTWNNYKNIDPDVVGLTTEIQTFGTSLFDYGHYPRSNGGTVFGGVVRSLADWVSEDAGERIVYRDNSLTGARLSHIFDKLEARLDDPAINLKTVIIDGGANDSTIDAGCSGANSTGAYSHLAPGDENLPANVRSYYRDVPKGNELMEMSVDDIERLIQDLEPYILAANEGPLCLSRFNSTFEAQIPRIFNKLGASDTVKDVFWVSYHYSDSQQANIVDHGAYRMAIACKEFNDAQAQANANNPNDDGVTCHFIDGRELWTPHYDPNIADVSASDLRDYVLGALQTIAPENLHPDADSNEINQSTGEGLSYADHYLWDQYHTNIAGSVLVSKFIFDRLKSSGACYIPGSDQCAN